MADKDEVDPTKQSETSAGSSPTTSGSATSRPAADPSAKASQRSGSHPLGRSSKTGAAASEQDDDEVDSAPDDEAGLELVPVGAPAQEQLAGDSVEVSARGRQKKVAATARQKQLVEKERRTGPVTFVRESVSELQKVVYPTGQQLANYFVVVLIFVLFIIAIVSVLDLAFGKAIIAIFS